MPDRLGRTTRPIRQARRRRIPIEAAHRIYVGWSVREGVADQARRHHMPIIVKPVGNIDNVTDGFDPETSYQMIPIGKTREMELQTGDFKAELSFSEPDISSMSNFRILQQKVPNLFPLPGPGVQVNRIALPEKSVIQFTLSGRQVGKTFLAGNDRPSGGSDLLPADFLVEISVKPHQIRRFAVCYLFDRVNRDKGVRLQFGRFFREISAIYEKQANTTLINIDGDASSNAATAKSIILNGTSGKTFKLFDGKLLGRVVDTFESTFPGVFAQTNCVVFPVTVPLVVGKKHPLGFQMNIHRKSDNQKFNTIFLGPTQNTKDRALLHTLAHEIGHTFGLDHNPAKQPPGPKPKVLPDPNLLPNSMHNLMFPTDLIESNRLNRNQIENLHLFIPPFRDTDI
jgi:Metallo-peptidase family M12B Reprolysin-like